MNTWASKLKIQTISLIISQKNKYLGTNLTIHVQDIDVENDTTLMKEFKNLKKNRETHCVHGLVDSI